MTIQGSIFPLDAESNPIEAERQVQQGFYYVKMEEPDETIPDDDGRRIFWDEPAQPYETVDLTLEQAQEGLPYRAQWREDRDPSGRTWGWELIE